MRYTQPKRPVDPESQQPFDFIETSFEFFDWISLEFYIFFVWLEFYIASIPYKLIMYYEMLLVLAHIKDNIDPMNEILADFVLDLACWKDLDLEKLAEMDPSALDHLYSDE